MQQPVSEVHRMTRPVGNAQLKAARQHAGYGSQQALADALTRAAPTLGLGNLVISARQVRRWESATPPWPRADHQKLLTHVLQRPIEELGFTPPWGDSATDTRAESSAGPRSGMRSATRPPVPLQRTSAAMQPTTIATDYAAITVAHRRLYSSVQPAQLHPAVREHANMGTQLLAETEGATRSTLATALAESILLLGRIEFFDLRQPDDADTSFVRALQAAGEADDALLGAAILAHAAFVPGWAGRREEAAERMRAARTYARRRPASPEFLAWLDAVEAECETLCGHTREALRLISHAEDIITEGGIGESPDWFTWFSPVRLAAFKGNTELKAGHFAQARETLTAALADLPEDSGKQRSVLLGDLAAVEAAQDNYEEACTHADAALDQLAVTWYATGMERINEVRRALQPWADTDCVRRLDDRLYGWDTTLSYLQH